MRALTALGVAALLAVTVLATDYTWDGSENVYWSSAANWDQGSSFPGDPAHETEDDAIITSRITYWPQLDGNYNSIVDLTMGGTSTNLDVSSYTLTASGTFRVQSGASVTISGSTGSISANTIVIDGTSGAASLTVSMTSTGSVHTY